MHYRAPLNFTWEGLEEARQALARIDEWLRRLWEAARAGNLQRHAPIAIEDDKFAEALDDDLNISAALGHLFEQIRESNRELDGGIDSARALAWLKWWERINQRPRAGGGGSETVRGNRAHGGGTSAGAD